MYRPAPILLALFLSACADFTGPTVKVVEFTRQEFLDEAENMREAYLIQHEADYHRVLKIGERIKIAAVPFCARRNHVVRGWGIKLWNQDTMGEDYRRAMHKVFDLDDKIKIRYVIENTPAARAGVQIGDIIVGIADVNLTQGKGLISLFGKKAVEILEKTDTVPLRLQRGEKEFQIQLETFSTCYYPLYIMDNFEPNANASEERIMVFTGMLRAVENDDALGGIIGHESAHVFMEHGNTGSENADIGFLRGLPLDLLLEVIGIRTGGYFSNLGKEEGYAAYSPEFEAEADYAGLYVTARAGYDLNATAKHWRRSAAQNPDGISRESSHPAYASRFIAISKTIQEIEAKKAANLPLIFDMKGDTPKIVTPNKEAAKATTAHH